MATPSGIEWNLEKSEYTFLTDFLLLHFSSKFYLDKFKDTRKNFNEEFNTKLNRIFRTPIVSNITISDLVLYSQIEKRGFYVYDVQDCLEYRGLSDFKFTLMI